MALFKLVEDGSAYLYVFVAKYILFLYWSTLEWSFVVLFLMRSMVKPLECLSDVVADEVDDWFENS